MFLNFIIYLLIIILNSGFHIFSLESDLQSVYDKYDKTPELHITVPKKLCELYKFHKTNILDDYKGYYAKKIDNNEKISTFCYNSLELLDTDSREINEELLLAIQYAKNSINSNKNFEFTKYSEQGHSGAEIYFLHGKNMKSPKIAKIFRCQSKEDLQFGFLELSNSLIALSLNPDPLNIKMARIHSAGYSAFPGSKEPWIFCMLLEKASGESIKQILHNNFEIYMVDSNLFNPIINNAAKYLAIFHVNSREKFNNIKIDDEVKIAEFKDRENFCLRRVKTLLQDLRFNPNGDFFKFKAALENIQGVLGQGICQSSKTPDSNEGHILLERHLEGILNKFNTWKIALEDRVVTHGDMHTGNLCYKEKHEEPPLHQLAMIDFSGAKRSYGAIDDPTQDLGKFLGSIWKEAAICFAQEHGNIDKNSMETLYNILYKWQESFQSFYMEAYVLAEAKLQKKSITDSASATIFRERVYFYKLCLYTQYFDDTRTNVNAEKTLNARELLLYFFLRESGLLDQVITANSNNADTGLKINSKQAPLQLGSNLVLCEDSVYPPIDASNYIPIIGRLERVTSDSDGQTQKQPVDVCKFIARLYNSNTIQ